MDNLVKLILEDVLKNGGNIRLFKSTIQSKISGITDFEIYFQNVVNLNQLFNTYKNTPSQANYQALCQQVESCNFSKSWIDDILNKVNLPIITKDNSSNKVIAEEKDNYNSSEQTINQLVTDEKHKEEQSFEKKDTVSVITKKNTQEKTENEAISTNTQQKTKYCRYCGKLISINHRFCRYCGKPL